MPPHEETAHSSVFVGKREQSGQNSEKKGRFLCPAHLGSDFTQLHPTGAGSCVTLGYFPSLRLSFHICKMHAGATAGITNIGHSTHGHFLCSAHGRHHYSIPASLPTGPKQPLPIELGCCSNRSLFAVPGLNDFRGSWAVRLQEVCYSLLLLSSCVYNNPTELLPSPSLSRMGLQRVWLFQGLSPSSARNLGRAGGV